MTYNASFEIFRLKRDGSVDDNAPKVCYKRDGQRFESEFTLKLLVETLYECQLNIRPPLPLHSVSVNGNSCTIEDLRDANATPSNVDSGGGSTFSFKWDTFKIDPDKRKGRTNLNLRLEFQGNIVLSLELQCKFYSLEDEDHLTWGQPLTRVDVEAQHKPGLTNLDVKKILYR